MNQHQPYMDVHQGHAPPSQYSQYAQPQPLQPSHGYTASYPPPYAYGSTMAPMATGHHVNNPMGGQMVGQPLSLPTMHSQPPPPAGSGSFDTSGQIAPPGMKPRVTATLWEDEGSLCFQVEANGVCVARREDNHMINGTKLLNVAGMTRGRRDGILKSEKTRNVVKIGPMHLKGVWIPFERALEFANKEKITEMLYPLFVHNIGALLYHPTNQARQSIGNAAMAARHPDRQPQGNTAYEYAGQATPGSAPMHPASSPPGSNPYHHASTPSYDAGRGMYSAPSFGGYPSQHMHRFGGALHSSPGSGIKSEMGPPGRGEHEHGGDKPHDGYAPHPADAEAEHEGDYTHGRPLADPSQVSPELTHSPHTATNGSGRATPRTTNPYGAYGTPQRNAPLPQSNLSYVMGTDARANGPSEPYPGSAPGGYAAPPPSHHQQHGPPQQPAPYPSMNGAPPPASQVSAAPSNKRMREVDDDGATDPYGRPVSASGDLKRQRTDGGPVGAVAAPGRPISQPQAVKAGGTLRR